MVKGRDCLQPDWGGSALCAQQSKDQGRTQRDLERPGQWPEGMTGERYPEGEQEGRFRKGLRISPSLAAEKVRSSLELENEEFGLMFYLGHR